MKKRWQIFFKVLDAIVWLWEKIKPSVEKEVETDRKIINK